MDDREEMREKRRQELQKIRSLKGAARLQYLWDYYKIVPVLVFALILVVSIITTMIKGITTDKIFQAAALSADYNATDDLIQADFQNYLGGLKRHQEITYDLSIGLAPDGGSRAEQIAEMKLQVSVSAGALDAVLVPDYAFSYLQERGMLASLDDVLSREEIEDYEEAGDLAYASEPDLEDLSDEDQSEASFLDYEGENTVGTIMALHDAQVAQSETEGDRTGAQPADISAERTAGGTRESASKDSGAETEALIETRRGEGQSIYGVRVDDSKILAKYAWYPAKQKVYFALVGNAKHPETAHAFLNFLKGVKHHE